ncbi:MAG: hypothetical protein ABIT36_00190 [Steroidobacteraceae bacterium]
MKRNFMGGVPSGVNGTPGLFINGERCDESREEESRIATLLQRAGG